MTSMKAMEKSVAKLAKKVSKKGDRKKTSCKRDCYESDSSDRDRKKEVRSHGQGIHSEP